MLRRFTTPQTTSKFATAPINTPKICSTARYSGGGGDHAHDEGNLGVTLAVRLFGVVTFATLVSRFDGTVLIPNPPKIWYQTQH